MSGGTLTDIANRLVDEYGCRETVVADVDDEIVAAIRGAVALRAVADDVLARLSAQAERVGTAKRSGISLRELLCANGLAPAVTSRVIRLGRAMQVLARVARHSRDASLSAEHLDAVARGVEHVVRRTGESVDSDLIDELEAGLIGHAVAGTTPADIVERARAVAIELTADDSDGGNDPDRLPPAEDSSLNELDWRAGDDGRLRGTFELDALTGERLITALDTASRPRPEPDGSDDTRPATRRRADAFSQFLECGTRGLSPDSSHGPARTEILLTIPIAADAATSDIAGPAWLSWMGPISDLSAKLLSCDARLAGVGLDLNGAPVSVTTPERLFTGAARKVVLLRDRGCIKCGAPASWCDVHHIVHHADGGPTTVDNGCLLCRSCHTAVHHAGWDIVMGPDRHPWLIPPACVDAQRRPLPAYNRRTLRLDDPVAA
ncbi:HNH endonuclease signature motif containing protein [Williamsia phyllosphaerae]|uniref:HNH nuclease domain-containing protein n=1 Tax=Williamsia phyllosphaerae TaxID=885042 RepID=A0ABQ1UQN2_9NOCA|nr:HNH endonuclease signature motif containing protein [Williamsia phyllosphaerae]GGF22507.1 hypothetical protein GCM10007298_18090 [Williamsia phyllosphaerae]